MNKQIAKNAVIYFVLINVLFTAPLRYFFTFVLGQNILNYLINILFGLLVLYKFKVRFTSIMAKYLPVVIYLVLLVCNSLLFENTSQIGFFLYLLQPLIFYGFFSAEVKEFIEKHFTLFVVLYAISALGIVYDYYFDYPWKSLNFKVGDTEIVFSRDWTAFGEERIAGLTRSSFDAAMTMMMLFIILLPKIKRLLVSHLLFAVTFACIWITTTKGCITSLLMIYVVYILYRSKFLLGEILIKAMGCVFLALLVVFPIGLMNDFRIPFLSNESLLDRIQNTWPFLLGQFHSLGQFCLGLGIGSVGTSQFLFQPERPPNLGDNLFMYLYCNFGLLALVLVLHLFVRFIKTGNQFFIYCALFTLSYGLTTNIFESAMGMFMISVCFFFPLSTQAVPAVNNAFSPGRPRLSLGSQ